MSSREARFEGEVWPLSLLLGSLMVGCLHDFDAFASGAGDASPAEGSVLDGAPDTGSTDTGSSDTAKPPDGATDAPPGDAGSCTEAGAKTFGGHCYFALSGTHTWDAGRTACTAAGAHLAVITSPEEETFVEGIASGDRWIGLSRPAGSTSTDASFVWITGETSSFRAWASGEPNGTGLCARIRSSGSWGDQTCSNAYTVICERG